MILTDNSSQNLDLVPFTCLANKLAYSKGKVTNQHGVAILGNPNKVVFDLVFCVTSLAILHGCHV